MFFKKLSCIGRADGTFVDTMIASDFTNSLNQSFALQESNAAILPIIRVENYNQTDRKWDLNRREYKDVDAKLSLVDPEIRQYVKLSLYSMPNVLRSYSTDDYNWLI